MNILDNIGAYFPTKLDKCNDEGCCVGLNNVKKRIIYKGELLVCYALGEQRKICDCFIFTTDDVLVVSLVELKRRTWEFSELEEKFDNAVTIVEIILKKQNIKKKYQIIPILLSKSFNKKPSTNPAARKFAIKIHGKRRSIVYYKCGKQLVDIIHNQVQISRKSPHL